MSESDLTNMASRQAADPRQAACFRFVGCEFDADSATASLRYAFDAGPELVEKIVFAGAPKLLAQRQPAFTAALNLLHWIAGVSYYKAGAVSQITFERTQPDQAERNFLHEVYFHGLAEFAYQNRIDLAPRLTCLLPAEASAPSELESVDLAPVLGLTRRTLLPIGGGKDSLVSVEVAKSIQEPASAVWIGDSALIESCALRTGLGLCNIKRELARQLFAYNQNGAWNGHVPVTAINSAILVCAAILFDYDVIAFSNERSASSATLEYAGRQINHQWSKGLDFEARLRAYIQSHIAADLDYFSLLRPWSELAIAKAFAAHTQYDNVFSSCNRNFRILGARATDRWCGQCPKCHFVFLALAPFIAKPRLLKIFGRNLLDDAALAPAFDALLEYRDHKPFECVGEGRESRAAMAALARKPEWREDAIVARFAAEIAPQLIADSPLPADLQMAALLAPTNEHFLPQRFAALLPATG